MNSHFRRIMAALMLPQIITIEQLNGGWFITLVNLQTAPAVPS